MDIAEWNGALFDALVRDVGAPGDPLYLYVDGEVLASISGGQPEEAIEDLRNAFRATSFAAASRQARDWRGQSFQGTPPHVAALCMTVLAATLESLGKAEHNVYSRQRDLLCLGDLDAGIPPGYGEHVPTLWSVWNEWLDGPGADFGVATAAPNDHFTIQGWARSQSFIRAPDKQDIYAFFDAKQATLDRGAPGEALVQALDRWLRERGSESRLARAAKNPDLVSELGKCLVAALRYWDGNTAAQTTPAHLEAFPHWSPKADAFSLVVRVREQRGALGVKVTDLGMEEWVVSSSDPFIYLTPKAMSASEWIDTPIRAWRFGPVWTVDWNPPADRLVVFEEALRGEWIATKSIRPGSSYRVLDLAEDRDLPAGITRTTAPGGIGHWLYQDGSPLLSGSVVARLRGSEAKDACRADVALVGGLRLERTSYLVGSEPDVWLRATPDDEPVVEVDGIAVAIEWDEAEVTARAPIWQLALDPGDHEAVVALSDHQCKRRFTTQDPEVTFESGLRGAEQTVHLSPIVTWRPGTAVLLLSSNGDAEIVIGHGGVPAWLEQVVAGAEFVVEPVSDFNACDGSVAGETLVAFRSSKSAAWRVGVAAGAIEQVVKVMGLTAIPADPASEDLLELLTSSAEGHIYLQDAARQVLVQAKREIGRNFVPGARASVTVRPASQATPPQSPRLERRTDIVPGRNPGNLLDDFVYWISERENGVGTALAHEGLDWLCRKYGVQAVALDVVVRNLRAIGHVESTGSRLRATSPRAVLLPEASGLALLTGRRSEAMLEELRTPSDDLPGTQSDALQNVLPFEAAQVDGAGTPLLPTTTYLRVEADDPVEVLSTLGFEFSSRWAGKSLASAVSPLRRARESGTLFERRDVRWEEFLPSDVAPGGRWRVTRGLPQQEAFLRARHSIGLSYVWWNPGPPARLLECGWIAGLWTFHSAAPTPRRLIDRVPSSKQLLVSDWAPLPHDIERAIVARSGLLPRLARVRSDASQLWKVYENVPALVVVSVRELVGQQNVEMRRPSADELEFL